MGTLLRRQTESYFLFSPSVQFLFCSVQFCLDLIRRGSGNPSSSFSNEKSPILRSNKQQIMFNFANPSIVLGTILRRQTESYFPFSPSVQFLFCSVQFCSDPIRRGSGNPSSLFADEKTGCLAWQKSLPTREVNNKSVVAFLHASIPDLSSLCSASFAKNSKVYATDIYICWG